jgi:hypothetical protein
VMLRSNEVENRKLFVSSLVDSRGIRSFAEVEIISSHARSFYFK